MEIHVDLHELDGLRRWYGKNTKLVRVASARMLNAFAVGTRLGAIEQINKTMTVRNKGFVGRQLRYTNASTNAPVNTQVSWAGSIGKARFSGWQEQEKGTKPLVNRHAMILGGRGGSIQKQMRPSIRLKSGVELVTPHTEGYNPRGGATNIGGFFAMIRRKKENRPILLARFKTLYKRKGKKIQAAQQFNRKQPKVNHWLKRARAIYFKRTNIGLLWRNTCNRLMSPP